MATTRETATQPWSYLPATLAADGRSATFTTTHFSLFSILWLDTKELAAAFKSEFLDGVTSGLTQTVDKPSCAQESQARGDGYTITSSRGDAVYWCFGIEGGTRVLKVTAHRRYPMEATHPNMTVVANPYHHLDLSSVSRLTSGKATIIEPGGTATFNADLARAGSESIATELDGAGQSLHALQVGIETLTSILTRFGAGSGPAAIEYLDKAVKLRSCSQGIAAAVGHGDVGSLISGCLSPANILTIYGVKGLLLAPIMAVGGVIAFFHSEYNALVDQFNGHDRYSIVIKRQPAAPVACPTAAVLMQALKTGRASTAAGHPVEHVGDIGCSGVWAASSYSDGLNAYPATYKLVGGVWTYVVRSKGCQRPDFPAKLHWICIGS